MTTPKWELERYLPLLRVMAWRLHIDARLRPRFDAPDVVGEALIRAAAGLDQFRGTTEAELVKWLQEILHSTFLDLVRREFAGRRTPEMEASLAACRHSSMRLEGMLAGAVTSPSARLERLEVMLRFAEAVEGLPPDQREVVLLRHVHDLPVKEIAGLVSRTEKAVAGLLLRGREQLRRSFPDYQEGGRHG